MANFAILFAGSAFLLKGLSFLVSIWLARTLSTYEYSSWGLAMTLQVGVSTFSIVGINESVVALLRNNSNKEDKITLQTAVVYTATFIFIITFILSFFIYTLFISFNNISIIGFLGVALSGFLLAFCNLQAHLYRIEEEHKNSILFSFLLPFIGLITGVLCFIYNNSVNYLFVGSSIGMFMMFIIFHKQILGFNFKTFKVWSLVHSLLIRIVPFILIAFFGWLSGYGNNFIISKFFSYDDVAIFTFVMSLGAVMQIFATSLNQVWSPRFYKSFNTKNLQCVERMNSKFFLIQGVSMGLIAMVLIILLPIIFNILGGNLVTYSKMNFEIFAIFSGYILLIPWWHCSNYFLVDDKGVNLMSITLNTSIIGVIISFILMIFCGPVGIYIGFFLQMLLRSCGIIFFSRRFWALKINWIPPAIGIFLASIGLVVS